MSFGTRFRLTEETKKRVRDLVSCELYTSRQVADILNKEGYKSAAGLDWSEKLINNARKSKWCGGPGKGGKIIARTSTDAKRITLEIMEELYHSGRDNFEIADWLNCNGYVTPRGKGWENHSVNYHMNRYGLPQKNKNEKAPVSPQQNFPRAVNSGHVVPIARQAAVSDDSSLLESIYNSNLSANDKLILTKRLMGID